MLSCPADVTVTFTIRDSCDRIVSCDVQYTLVNEVPVISCPSQVNLEACDVGILQIVALVGNLEYSDVRRNILLSDLQGIGGDASDNCGIDSCFLFSWKGFY